MSKKIKILFAVVIVTGIVFQFIIPATMILRQEEILRKGVRVCFETGAVDPLDVFCGRYVDLNLAEFNNWSRRYLALTNPPNVVLYVVLNTNEHGVAKVARVTPEKPEGEDALFFIVNRRDVLSEKYLMNPFKKFYMPEKLAPVAEDIYREMVPRQGQETTNSVLLAVRIHNGKAAVEDLLVNGTPMIQAAQTRLKAQKENR